MRKLWCIGFICFFCVWGVNTSLALAKTKPSFQRVLYMLKHPYWRIKWQGMCLLEEYYIQQEKAIEVVGKILLPQDPTDEYETTKELRQRAIRWLATFATPVAWGLLLKGTTSEPSLHVQLVLVKTLGHAPVLQKRVLQSLHRFHTHPHQTLRDTAKQAWTRLYRQHIRTSVRRSILSSG